MRQGEAGVVGVQGGHLAAAGGQNPLRSQRQNAEVEPTPLDATLTLRPGRGTETFPGLEDNQSDFRFQEPPVRLSGHTVTYSRKRVMYSLLHWDQVSGVGLYWSWRDMMNGCLPTG